MHDPADPGELFAAFVAQNPECLDPRSFAVLEERNPLPGYALQPWPILLDPLKVRRMRANSVALVEIARDLPQRLFEQGAERMAEYFNLPGGEAMAELLFCEPNGIREALYRGDFMETGEGFKCIEINAGSGVSGWNLSPLAGLYAEVPAIRRFLAESGLGLAWEDTLTLMFRHFLRCAAQNPCLEGERTLNVAIPVSVVDDDIYNAAALEHCRQAYAVALAEERRGSRGDVFFCDYADLTFENGSPRYQGHRIHILFEQQIVEGAQRRQAIGSFKAGRLDLYTGPASQIIMDKRLLALLSELRGTGLFDAAQERVLEDTVPWTRRLIRAETAYRGERVSLPAIADQERARLVLKKAWSHSGKHVILGSSTPPREWSEAISAALEEEGDWILQEALESSTYELLDHAAGGPRPHNVVWGLFAFGGGFRGGFVRVLPAERRAVINVIQGARTLPFFEVSRDGAAALAPSEDLQEG